MSHLCTQGLKLLEAVAAQKADAHTRREYWRGLRDTKLPFAFLAGGGTELSFSSTSRTMEVALGFADSACPLLLQFVSADFNTRGADIEFLSVYGAREREILYPPLTYLRCTGTHKIEVPAAFR